MVIRHTRGWVVVILVEMVGCGGNLSSEISITLTHLHSVLKHFANYISISIAYYYFIKWEVLIVIVLVEHKYMTLYIAVNDHKLKTLIANDQPWLAVWIRWIYMTFSDNQMEWMNDWMNEWMNEWMTVNILLPEIWVAVYANQIQYWLATLAIWLAKHPKENSDTETLRKTLIKTDI